MDSKPRGFCIIINIDGVLGEKPREGSNQDVLRASDVFQSFHFEVKKFQDLTAEVRVFVFVPSF